MIREFFVIRDSGALLFHRQYRDTDTDVDLRAGLISALYSFVVTVENDSIDYIRMKKFSILFNKKENYIFCLFLDSRVHPVLGEGELAILQQRFFEPH